MEADDSIWSLTTAAKLEADRILEEDLPRIDLGPLANVIVRDSDHSRPSVFTDPLSKDVFADSLLDLSRLLDEIRFEVAFAVMLLVDFAERRPDEVARLTAPPTSPSIPTHVLALLSPHFRPTPSPSSLTEHLHSVIGPGPDSHLSRWLAAQLLDSALPRAISCLDRLATMLRLASGHPATRRDDGTLILPGFSTDLLRQLKSTYAGRDGWEELRELARHPLFTWVKQVRNGQIHHRRWPSILHGERNVTYWAHSADGEPLGTASSPGLTAQEHVAVLVSSWNHLLTPAVRLASQVMATGGMTEN